MKFDNKKIGRIGEEAAIVLLTKKGYQIIKKNFATRFGEIDIVAKEGQTTVFVEVKTKKGLEFGSPEDMYTKWKARKVERMATIYMDGKFVNCRIDMIAVVLDNLNKVVRLTHYQNVVLY